MAKQLNIRSDEAYRLATDLARRTGRTKSDVVYAALLKYGEERTGRQMTPEQRVWVEEILALARKSAAAAPKSRSKALYEGVVPDPLP